MSAIRVRVDAFCRRFGLELPVLLAPISGASAPALSIAVMNAGGLGACGALLMQPDEIAAWAVFDQTRRARERIGRWGGGIAGRRSRAGPPHPGSPAAPAQSVHHHKAPPRLAAAWPPPA